MSDANVLRAMPSGGDPVASHPRQAPAWRRRVLQTAGIVRLEFHHYFKGRRSWGVWLLAITPVALLGLRALVMTLFRTSSGVDLPTLASEEQIFADLFQALYLRLCIFFGCVVVFINAFRGELLERTLHYYFLAPVRRELLVVGKLTAGIAFTWLLFGTSVVVGRWLLYLPHGSAATTYLTTGDGLTNTLIYLGVTGLACLGYGSVFLVAGMLVRNPILPAILLLAWEAINIFLPPPLRQMSVIYYLVSLVPVPPSASTVALTVAAAPAHLAVPGLLALAGVSVAIAALSARRLEIDYSGE